MLLPSTKLNQGYLSKKQHSLQDIDRRTNQDEVVVVKRREHQETEKCKMARFTAFISMLSIVLLRKCIHMYNEYAPMLMDMAFVLMSSVRFSGSRRFRPTDEAVSGRIITPMMTSMMGRPDRQLAIASQLIDHIYMQYALITLYFFPHMKSEIHGEFCVTKNFDQKFYYNSVSFVLVLVNSLYSLLLLYIC